LIWPYVNCLQFHDVGYKAVIQFVLYKLYNGFEVVEALIFDYVQMLIEMRNNPNLRTSTCSVEQCEELGL
jgi:hypothetical protein